MQNNVTSEACITVTFGTVKKVSLNNPRVYLSLRRTILLEKLIVSQLVNRLSEVFRARGFIAVPTQIYLNPAQKRPSYKTYNPSPTQ